MGDWGGKREGAGRKSVDNKKKSFSIYLTSEEKEQLENINKNKNEAVKFLLNFYYNLKK